MEFIGGGILEENINLGTFLGAIFKKGSNFEIMNHNDEEFIPKSEKTPYNEPMNENANIYNIIFKASSGFSANISIPGNATVKSLIQKYMDYLKFTNNPLRNSQLAFLYNPDKIDPLSNELVCNIFRYLDHNFLKVIEAKNLLG